MRTQRDFMSSSKQKTWSAHYLFLFTWNSTELSWSHFLLVDPSREEEDALDSGINQTSSLGKLKLLTFLKIPSAVLQKQQATAECGDLDQSSCLKETLSLKS